MEENGWNVCLSSRLFVSLLALSSLSLLFLFFSLLVLLSSPLLEPGIVCIRQIAYITQKHATSLSHTWAGGEGLEGQTIPKGRSGRRCVSKRKIFGLVNARREKGAFLRQFLALNSKRGTRGNSIVFQLSRMSNLSLALGPVSPQSRCGKKSENHNNHTCNH